MPVADTPDAQVSAVRQGADLRVVLSGEWKVQRPRPDAAPIFAALDQQNGGALRFDLSGLVDWDSSLIVLLSRLEQRCCQRNIDFRCDTLPEDIAGLISLSQAVPEKQTGRGESPPAGPLDSLGRAGLRTWAGGREFVDIVGESVLSLGRLVRRKGVFNWRDFWLTLHETSVGALPIVGLISFLTGLILAFVGSVQLEKFGATIYVANLVGLGMVREMGALMTAIIMAGRTGAAFAAQLGSMKVNEELDALKTLAISPQDFLITPRLLALFIMMPLLCLYSDLIGMVGGASVALGLMNLSWAQYLTQTHKAMTLLDVSTGLKYLIGLKEPEPGQGDIRYFGEPFTGASDEARVAMLRRFGVLYQGGALWSSMTLAENVALPLEQYTPLNEAEISDLVSLKLSLVGLRGFEEFYPAEISGGMRKRAGLARAMALDPEILFFDEPSAGLDPISSRHLDDLILRLRDSLGATVVVVTHELASIFAIADDSIFLDAESRGILARGSPHDLLKDGDPKVQHFLRRERPSA